jgi:hypothetical protein
LEAGSNAEHKEKKIMEPKTMEAISPEYFKYKKIWYCSGGGLRSCAKRRLDAYQSWAILCKKMGVVIEGGFN